MRRSGLVILFMLFAGAGLLAAGYGLVPLPFNLGDEKPVTAAKPQSAPSKSPDGPAPFAKVTEGSTPTETTDTTIDISRISPDGGSVFAGRAAPNAYVTVYEDGEPVASGKADDQGEWSLVTDHKFATSDPNLSVKAGDEPGPEIASADDSASAPSAERPASPTAPAAAPPTSEAPGAAAPEAHASADSSANAAAADLMKKFEAMVEEARKDAEEAESKAPVESTTGQSESKAPPPSESKATPPPASASSEPPATRSDTPSAVAEAETPSAADRSPSVAAQQPGTSPAKPVRPAGAQPLTVPVPIMFVYNEPTLTDEGRHAASLLLEYIKLKHLGNVSLSGHADERGTVGYNMELSRERLDTVAGLLRDGGYAGTLDLKAMGESEPFNGIDRTKYSGEALYQLDRRVELHLTQ